VKAMARLWALLLCFVSLTVSAQSFYEARFLGGVADFGRGAYARAVDQLRVAAFGRVDDIPRYEITQIYLVLANNKLARDEDARLAALKLLQAEQISPSYRALDLPHDIRVSFEALLPSLVTREQLAHLPAFEPIASLAPAVPPGTPQASTRPRPAVPTPTKEPNVAVTVKKKDDNVEPPDLDYGTLALQHVAAGDEPGQRGGLAGDVPARGLQDVDRHPEARFIIDHLGILQPRTPPAPPQPWADLPKVLELARRKNAVIKVSGACTLSREPYPFPDIWDPLARVFDAWGFDRCLWGTDWTRAFAVVNYEQAVEPFIRNDRLSDTERAMLMGGVCAKAYGWSPKKN